MSRSISQKELTRLSIRRAFHGMGFEDLSSCGKWMHVMEWIEGASGIQKWIVKANFASRNPLLTDTIYLRKVPTFLPPNSSIEHTLHCTLSCWTLGAELMTGSLHDGVSRVELPYSRRLLQALWWGMYHTVLEDPTTPEAADCFRCHYTTVTRSSKRSRREQIVRIFASITWLPVPRILSRTKHSRESFQIFNNNTFSPQGWYAATLNTFSLKEPGRNIKSRSFRHCSRHP